MSDDNRPSTPPSSEPPLGRELAEAVTSAMAAQGRLFPETPDEVAKLEQSLDIAEFPLPERLREFDDRFERTSAEAPLTEVVHLEERRRSGIRSASPRRWLRDVAWFALGAAAAGVLWFTSTDTAEPEVAVSGVGSELKPSATTTAPSSTTLRLDSSCNDCCAGAECTNPSAVKDPDGTLSCASGRKCVSCNSDSEKNAYKLRISAIGFTPEGRLWAANYGGVGNLQVCAEIQGKSLGCRSAVEEPEDLLEWSSLPVATTSGQLVGGLRIHVRALNAPVGQPPLAEWANAVTVKTDTLCRGLSARFNVGELNIGRVSVFFDDPYFVEIRRAGTVGELLDLQRTFAITGNDALRVYETTSSADQMFALVYGPTDRPRAERVRWQLLDQNLNAPIVVGSDYRGQPRPR